MSVVSKTILLIEDNASDVALAQRALQKAHITNEMVIKEDGQDALDYLFGTGPQGKPDPAKLPAIILLDLNLPKISGLEVLRKIRSNEFTRRLPVVLLTSSKEEQDVAAGYDLGANSYIRKPVDFAQFAFAIAQLGLYWLVLNELPPKVEKK